MLKRFDVKYVENIKNVLKQTVLNIIGNCEMKKIWSSENSVVRARQNS